ncbi:MAG: hypothetical protein M0Q45_10380 [Bacteroidales bacterium]|nr:hypothetical protein [Bacteroidales bacterium]MCK9499894.1 hypothetical protein [Bacteroidales bacterium]MDY0315287.1 hypothetical protein [Bacteroidales bacterium]
MKKNILLYLTLAFLISSCSIIDKTLCRNYYSTDDCFRASSIATSTNEQLSSEKALLIAKTDIALEVDNYILSKFNHKTFLEDTEFENKISIARKTILQDITIICSRTSYNRSKKVYKTRLSIEMSKSKIDDLILQILKGETK